MRDFTWIAVALALLGCGAPEPAPEAAASPEPAVEAPQPAPAPARTDGAPTASAPARPDGAPTASPPPEPAEPAAEEPAAPTIQPDSYFVPSGDVPPERQVPGFAWLQQVPGLSYFMPRLMPADLHRRFQTLEGTQRLLGDFDHEWLRGGTALRLTRLSSESILSHWLGLKAGDVVLFVNHEPISAAATADAARALHERLKTERRFAVLIERGDKQFVLSFYVG